jgi:peptidoglycan/xylan/chitin deacetylase (PgdA/CDA1 family)
MPNFPWPNGAKVAVALTFDMDGETIPFVYDPASAAKRLTLQSEASYGPNIGMPRILDLLDRHGIPASFFIPGFTAEKHPDILQEMIRRGHEVGHHGYLHERPDFVSEADEEAIMIKGLEVLESITGKRPIGYRSPAWELKPTSPALLKRYGFLYDSSLMGDDEPYLIQAGGADERLIEIPIQWINDDWPHFGFSSVPALGTGIGSPQKVFEVWSEEFAGYHQFGGCYVLTMHPFVIGRPSRIRLLDRLINYMKEYDGVWFAALEQIARHVEATNAAIYRPYTDMTVRWSPSQS